MPVNRSRAHAFTRLGRRAIEELRQSRFATQRAWRRPTSDEWTVRRQRFSASDHHDASRFAPHLYVTNHEMRALHPINGRFSPLIDNKGLLPALMSATPELLPRRFISLMGNRFLLWTEGSPIVRSRREFAACVAELIEAEGPLVLRPLGGSGGAGVSLVGDREELERHLATRWEFVLTSQLESAAYSAAVWPHSLNTIRVYAHQSRGGGLRMFRVVQRFGTAVSGFIDHSTAGGVVAPVDLPSGRLTTGYLVHPAADRRRHGPGSTLTPVAQHPDTGVTIAGLVIPDWNDVRCAIQQALDAMPFLSYVGLDVASTPDGLKLIEVNSLAGAG